MPQAPNPNSVARVVRWAIILFFAYALWHSSFAPQKPPAPVAALKEKDCGNKSAQTFPAALQPDALPCLVSGTLPSSPMPLRMIDTKSGIGKPAECGDSVTANITIWKLDGTKLFSTLDGKPVTFILGKSEQIPVGIEQGMAGMMEGSERTLVIPPAFTKLLDPSAAPLKALASLSWPEHEMVLVEMTRLPAVEKSAATPNTK